MEDPLLEIATGAVSERRTAGGKSMLNGSN